MRSRKLIIATVLLLYVFLACNQRKNNMTILSFGGTYGEAQKEAYIKPFIKEFGIPINDASYNGEYGKVEAAIKIATVPWDVIVIESAALMRGIDNNLFENLDFSIIDTTNILQMSIEKNAIGTDIYSMSLGYNTNVFQKYEERPNDWKDFWDVGRFPGKRCMKKDPKFSLEIALLADGVPMDKIYEGDTLDIERAFRKLDEIKPYVAVWWTTGQQPIQLLADEEVVMVAAFGARLWIAEYVDKYPIALTWNQSIADVEYWAVPKGLKEKERAMRFINFALKPENQAEFSKRFPLGPTNKKAFEYMPLETSSKLNTYPDNFEKHFFLNTKYWQKNEAQILERWNKWLIE